MQLYLKKGRCLLSAGIKLATRLFVSVEPAGGCLRTCKYMCMRMSAAALCRSRPLETPRHPSRPKECVCCECKWSAAHQCELHALVEPKSLRTPAYVHANTPQEPTPACIAHPCNKLADMYSTPMQQPTPTCIAHPCSRLA